MNARILVFIAMALWSGVCWWWYVCGVKDLCNGSAATAKGEAAIEIPDVAPADTATAYLPDTGAETGGVIDYDRPATADMGQNIDVVNIYELEELTRIHFPYGSTSKEDDALVDDYLTRLAAHLKQSGKIAVIAGHTDMVGERKYNLTLALKRANSIRDLLVAKGMPRSQIKCTTYGESRPLATNDNKQGRYQNRRVEITIQ